VLSVASASSFMAPGGAVGGMALRHSVGKT